MNEDLKALIEECAIAKQKYIQIKQDFSIAQAEANRFLLKLGTIHDFRFAMQVSQNIKEFEEELSEAKSEFTKMEAIVTDFRKRLSQLSSESQSERANNIDNRIAEANLKELIIHFNFLHGKYFRLDKEAKKSEKVVRDFERSGAAGVALGNAIQKATNDRCNASEVYQSLLDLKKILNEPSVAELVKNRTILRDLSVARAVLSKLTKTETQLQSCGESSLSFIHSSTEEQVNQDRDIFRELSSTRDKLDNSTLSVSQVQISMNQALSCHPSSSQEFLLEDDEPFDLQSILSKILSEMKAKIDKDRKLNKNIYVLDRVYQDINLGVADFKQSKDYEDLKICIDNGIRNLNTIDCKIYNTYVYCLNVIIDICNLFINLMLDTNPYPKISFFKPPFTSKLEGIKKKLEQDYIEDTENEYDLGLC